MSKVDLNAMHAEHREARMEHRDWLEDIARWRNEHRQADAMLEAIKAAWNEAEATLDEHARQIQVHEEHLDRHEQAFRDNVWIVDDIEDESSMAEHESLELVHAAARKVHDEMRHLHSGVMAEVFELLKITHPDAVVLERG